MSKKLLIGVLTLAAIYTLAPAFIKAENTNTSNNKEASMSFIILGDLHYDKLEDHDMDYLRSKPGDLRQVTDTYVPNTNKNWADLMTVILGKTKTVDPKVMGIVQLGDLSEGLAGTPEKARQMANSVIDAVKTVNSPAPWILTKGNHDITGPGAREAFTEIYTPFIREQIGNPAVKNATYSYEVGDALFVVLDLWDSKVDQITFAEKVLGESNAKYKFVTMHEPAIPVTERCWHAFRKTPEQREKFIEVLGKNKAIVLTAHLHRYSVVKRDTKYGPIIQVMVASVIGVRRNMKPTYSFNIKEYGSGLVDWKPSYEPQTADARREMLDQESKFVSYYKMCDLPGYAQLSITPEKGVELSYWAAFSDKPYDTVNLTNLQNNKVK